METKICTKCKKELPATVEYFARDKKGKLGLRPDCKECSNKIKKIYRENNREKIREYDKLYYQDDKEHILMKNKKYRQAHDTQIKEHKKKYRKENAISISEHKKDYYEQNKGFVLSQCKEYRERNKEEVSKRLKKYLGTKYGRYLKIIRQHRYRSLKRQLKNDFTGEEWCKCLEYFNYSCAYCGNKTNNLEQEHVIAVKNGGEYTKTNIIPACKRCNCSKQDNALDVWYPKQKFYSIDRENKIKQYLSEMHFQKEV